MGGCVRVLIFVAHFACTHLGGSLLIIQLGSSVFMYTHLGGSDHAFILVALIMLSSWWLSSLLNMLAQLVWPHLPGTTRDARCVQMIKEEGEKQPYTN